MLVAMRTTKFKTNLIKNRRQMPTVILPLPISSKRPQPMKPVKLAKLSKALKPIKARKLNRALKTQPMQTHLRHRKRLRRRLLHPKINIQLRRQLLRAMTLVRAVLIVSQL